MVDPMDTEELFLSEIKPDPVETQKPEVIKSRPSSTHPGQRHRVTKRQSDAVENEKKIKKDTRL